MTKPGGSALYITYDGLLDPLGGSQIVPYLKAIAGFRVKLTVLSFEKPWNLRSARERLEQDLAQVNIDWIPLRFTSRFGPLGKLWDMMRMYKLAAGIALRQRPGVVHARGHPPGMAALLVKRLTGAKFLFDFRGFWVDERVDKGGWDLSRPFDALQYRLLKQIERKLLAATDQLVVLTEAAIPQVRELGLAEEVGISVIPCCADFDHFGLAGPAERSRARQIADIPSAARVLGYLGSIGRMYMIERVMRLFVLAAEDRPELFLLFVTKDRDDLDELIARHVPSSLRSRIRVRSANRDEVPQLVPAMDILVSFIQPSWARAGASPTKLAECFAIGIPAICNAGVGDVAAQMRELDAGEVVEPQSDDDLIGVSRRIDDIVAKGGQRLREAAIDILGLDVAAERYRNIYQRLDAC